MWRRSSRCEGGACLEVAVDGEQVLLRSSTRPGVVVSLTAAEWDAFIGGVQDGDAEFRLTPPLA